MRALKTRTADKNGAKTFFGRLRSLLKNQSGVAFIEFAYTLPIFVGFGMVGIEFTNVVLAFQKSERVASTIADQIAANQIAPNERQIQDMYKAVQQISEPFEFAPTGNVIITAVIGIYDEDDDEVQNKVAWQRCLTKDSFESKVGSEWSGTSDIADGPKVPLQNKLQLGQNQMVIVSEVFFPYKEIISEKLVNGVLPGDGIFTETSTFRTRGGAIMNVTPVAGVPKHSC